MLLLDLYEGMKSEWWVHLSNSPVLDPSEIKVQHQTSEWTKPNGFWLAYGSDWIRFAHSTKIRHGSKYIHRVKVKNNKIITLEDKSDVPSKFRKGNHMFDWKAYIESVKAKAIYFPAPWRFRDVDFVSLVVFDKSIISEIELWKVLPEDYKPARMRS